MSSAHGRDHLSGLDSTLLSSLSSSLPLPFTLHPSANDMARTKDTARRSTGFKVRTSHLPTTLARTLKSLGSSRTPGGQSLRPTRTPSLLRRASRRARRARRRAKRCGGACSASRGEELRCRFVVREAPCRRKSSSSTPRISRSPSAKTERWASARRSRRCSRSVSEAC